MAEAQAYLIAAARGAIQSLSGKPLAEQARPILEQLFQNGIPARRIQEIHWHGREDEYWLNNLGETQGFSPDIARFFWASAPLIAHSMLHLAARAIEAGERELVILAQESGDQVSALLIGSPAAVEESSAAPRLRIANKLVLSSRPNGLSSAIAAVLTKAGQDPAGVHLIASARQPAQAAGEKAFANARWLTPGGEIHAGDYFLLPALADALEAGQGQRGLLVSEGPQKSSLVTVFERG